MKKLIARIAITLVVASLMGITALAKVKKGSITLNSNMRVNGTLVKKGTYELRFDEEKSELSVVKNGKVVASANTTTEKRDQKAKNLEVRSTGTGDDTRLTKVAFAGMEQNLVLAGSAASN